MTASNLIDISSAKDKKQAGEKSTFEGALELLLKHAQTDTGGGKRCAMFLLSLWNGDEFQADLQSLMYTDPDIFGSMIYVFHTLYQRNQQLESVVTEDRIKPIYEMWGGII